MMAKWRDIRGYEDRYQVSDEGEVKRLAHVRRCVAQNGTESTRRVPEKLLKLIDRDGYRIVTLYKSEDECRHWYVHFLVLRAFVGNPAFGQESLHNDGSRSNNRLGNLRWGTHGENLKDALKHGAIRRDECGVIRSVA